MRVHVLVIVFQVGNLGLLFMLLFFIYAALGVELFGELGESEKCTQNGRIEYIYSRIFERLHTTHHLEIFLLNRAQITYAVV